MGSSGPVVDTAAVRELYTRSQAARSALDHFAKRKNKSAITTVDRLQAALRSEGDELGRGEILEVFKALARANCGIFVIGRKGHPSRFEWSVNLVDLGRSASGEPVKVEAIASPATNVRPTAIGDEEDDALVEHRYRLRPDLELRFDLPTSLTAAEASRISDFIKTLPFG